jgi:hypothetical protein
MLEEEHIGGAAERERGAGAERAAAPTAPVAHLVAGDQQREQREAGEVRGERQHAAGAEDDRRPHARAA